MTADGGEEVHECPVDGCEYSSGSGRGVKIHHKKAHGVSIAGIEVECEWCGKTRIMKSNMTVPSGRHFCKSQDGGPNSECKNKWQSKHFSGDQNPSWGGGTVDVECAWCGDLVSLIPSHIDRSERHFCKAENGDRISDCYRMWLSENRSGEDNSLWDGGAVSVECAWCGESKRVNRYNADRSEYHFCPADDGTGHSECRREWLSKNWRGEDSPVWNGGSAIYYGPNWDRQRLRTIIRDAGRCVGCSKPATEQFETHGYGFHVHHIRPLKTFLFINADYDRDWESANALSNLVTCCTSCHNDFERESRENYPPDEYPRYIHPPETGTETPAEVVQADLSEFV